MTSLRAKIAALPEPRRNRIAARAAELVAREAQDAWLTIFVRQGFAHILFLARRFFKV